MNQPTPIIVTEYTGREVNPHRKPKYIDLVPYIQSESNKLWLKFERSVKSYPCPSIANTEPGKTILAELKWQFWAPNSLYPEWEDCDPNETWREEWCRGNGCKTRQIWVPIVEQKQLRKMSIDDHLARIKEIQCELSEQNAQQAKINIDVMYRQCGIGYDKSYNPIFDKNLLQEWFEKGHHQTNYTDYDKL